MMRGTGMIFLDQVPGTHRLRTVSSVGEVFPITTTANGQACLAALPEDAAQALIRDEWDRRGIDGDMTQFMARLDAVRASGLAYDLDEHTQGISAIGFAFKDLGQTLHAISVPVPSSRFPEVRQTVEEALRRTARHIKKAFDLPD
jgi:DNA-binding IclR family transcriptional regulator